MQEATLTVEGTRTYGANSESVLPHGWDITDLGSLVSIIRGVSYDKADASDVPGDESVAILRATNISNRLDFDNPVYVPPKYVSRDQYLQPGDIVVAASSGSRSVVGKAAMLEREWHGSFGAFCLTLRPSSQLEARAIAFFLQTTEYRNRISELAAGVNINNLKRQHIQGIPFRLPPFREQRRIVAEIEKQFTRLEAAVAALKRVQANLKRYRASVLKAACEGRLVPTEAELARTGAGTGTGAGAEAQDEAGAGAGAGDGAGTGARPYEPADQLLARILKERRAKWEADQLAKMQNRRGGPVSKMQNRRGGSPCPPGRDQDDKWKAKYKEPVPPDTSNLPELPEGWAWASADSLCVQITDGEHIQPPYTEQGFPLLTAKNVRDGLVISEGVGFIDRESFQKALMRCAPRQDDVLIVSVGATTGRAAIVGTCEPFAIVRSVLLLRPLITPRFLLTWARSPRCQEWIKAASGSTAQAHFYIKDTRRMPVPVPPAGEQSRIVAEVERRLSVIDELEATVEANLKRAERLRQSILKRAFEGKLVPQDPNDEPASVLLERIRAERAQLA